MSVETTSRQPQSLDVSRGAGSLNVGLQDCRTSINSLSHVLSSNIHCSIQHEFQPSKESLQEHQFLISLSIPVVVNLDSQLDWIMKDPDYSGTFPGRSLSAFIYRIDWIWRIPTHRLQSIRNKVGKEDSLGIILFLCLCFFSSTTHGTFLLHSLPAIMQVLLKL